jgi:stress response protein YsnF
LLIEPGADLPRIRTEGSVTIFPVLEEVVVVEKRLRLKEEVRITKRVTTENTETPITVRKQRAVIERLNSEGGPITEAKD